MFAFMCHIFSMEGDEARERRAGRVIKPRIEFLSFELCASTNKALNGQTRAIKNVMEKFDRLEREIIQ